MFERRRFWDRGNNSEVAEQSNNKDILNEFDVFWDGLQKQTKIKKDKPNPIPQNNTTNEKQEDLLAAFMKEQESTTLAEREFKVSKFESRFMFFNAAFLIEEIFASRENIKMLFDYLFYITDSRYEYCYCYESKADKLYIAKELVLYKFAQIVDGSSIEDEADELLLELANTVNKRFSLECGSKPFYISERTNEPFVEAYIKKDSKIYTGDFMVINFKCQFFQDRKNEHVFCQKILNNGFEKLDSSVDDSVVRIEKIF